MVRETIKGENMMRDIGACFCYVENGRDNRRKTILNTNNKKLIEVFYMSINHFSPKTVTTFLDNLSLILIHYLYLFVYDRAIS